jgi:hypothetical protein
VDISSIANDGKISPPTLFLMACEKYRKKCFIEAWLKANQWFTEEDPKTPRLKDHLDVNEKAELILLMNAEDIKKKLAGIKI